VKKKERPGTGRRNLAIIAIHRMAFKFPISEED
jgi:hypothetical protein